MKVLKLKIFLILTFFISSILSILYHYSILNPKKNCEYLSNRKIVEDVHNFGGIVRRAFII